MTILKGLFALFVIVFLVSFICDIIEELINVEREP